MVRVTVWNEGRAEQENPHVREVYPDGITAPIVEALRDRGHEVDTASLDDPRHGLTEATIRGTDVLVWWAHQAHDEVEDGVVADVKEAVLDGMGLLVLHSAHHSKLFRSLVGTSALARWREAGERERLWVVEPGHPVVDGLDHHVTIPEAEMYGEPFDVPAPDTLVFVSWFEGGEVFRSGCCYRRGKGRIFYFQPGHEEYPIYSQDEVRRILANAVDWTAPGAGPERTKGSSAERNAEPLEELGSR